MDVLLVILVVGALAIAIAYYAIREDQQDKEIQNLIDKALDRDNDGVILEGTPLERKVSKRPVKKAAVKKKATAPKAKAKPKAKPKKSAPVKKKAVAKKKSR